ncbi:YchJ family protein [Arthrobacter sp. B3I4]|uniref:YchJ family protein n=1 Tax=Arthrobacter sp. B3I4 TaxID=3042267 RepID=UPI0027806FEE|nr:YchJ family metal-binding protein [Arthrobacter sp. B3I4]MDQ0754887.1 SEC-C motif-containing protein [Arthrobacter sp. B3I4]
MPHPQDTGSQPAGIPYEGNCPCLSGEQYNDCCGRYHRGEAEAPTAEQLMRSRYAAFVVLDAGYLLRTWHPDTRPGLLELDPEIQWRRLDIVSTSAGGPLDSDGVVEFKAYFRHDGERGLQQETSRFVRRARRWYYLGAMKLA